MLSAAAVSAGFFASGSFSRQFGIGDDVVSGTSALGGDQSWHRHPSDGLDPRATCAPRLASEALQLSVNLRRIRDPRGLTVPFLFATAARMCEQPRAHSA